MKILFLIGLSLLVIGSVAFAQDRRAEVYVGYSNLQAEGIPNPNDPGQAFDDDFFDRRRGMHGVNASLTGYLSSAFGIKGDFSYHRKEDSFGIVSGRDSTKNRVFYFMGGPTLKLRSGSRVEPFVHALAGGAHTSFEAETTIDVPGGTARRTFDTGTTDFAAAIGGGVDVRLGERFKVRLFQFDYAPVFLRDRSIDVLGDAGAIQRFTLEGQRQDNIRISIGIVF